MSSAAVEAVDTARMNDEQREEVQAQFNQLRSQVQQYASKIGEMQGECAEHQLVVDTIKDMEPERKCFRLVGGVLVERTVKEVLPAVTKNLVGLTELMGKLRERLQEVQEAKGAFEAKYNIRQSGGPPEQQPQQQQQQSQGLLVAGDN
jgi:prefoldin subunit 2